MGPPIIPPDPLSLFLRSLCRYGQQPYGTQTQYAQPHPQRMVQVQQGSAGRSQRPTSSPSSSRSSRESPTNFNSNSSPESGEPSLWGAVAGVGGALLGKFFAPQQANASQGSYNPNLNHAIQRDGREGGMDSDRFETMSQSSFTSRGSGGAITNLGSMQPPPPPPPRSPPLAPPTSSRSRSTGSSDGGFVLSQPPHDVLVAMQGGADGGGGGGQQHIPEDVKRALDRQRGGGDNLYRVDSGGSASGGGGGGARNRYVDTFNHQV